MQPIIFEPILKRIRWGGRKLGSVLGKPIGPENDYAESWEIADHAAGLSTAVSQPFAGQSLQQILHSHGQEIFGRAEIPPRFPLLIKFLDAHDWLSLQVHPNDVQAHEFDPAEQGKTEAWVVVQAEPDSEVCTGLRAGVTRADLETGLRHGTFQDCLHRYQVQAGDCIFVPAGTVHALGPGILLAEVQQQSNLTFRLSDWGRSGTDGQPRPLHIAESLDCTDFERGPVNPLTGTQQTTSGYRREHLVSCEYFSLVRHSGNAVFPVQTDGVFRVLMALAGQANCRSADADIRLVAGSTILIPAACQSVTVQPDPECVVLEISAD